MPLATQCFPLPHNKSLQLHIPTSQTGWDGLRTSRRLKHQACLPFMHLLSTSPPPLNSLLLPQPRAPNSEPQMLLLQPGEKQTAAFYFDSIKLAAAAAADVPKTQIDPWGRRRKGGMAPNGGMQVPMNQVRIPGRIQGWYDRFWLTKYTTTDLWRRRPDVCHSDNGKKIEKAIIYGGSGNRVSVKPRRRHHLYDDVENRSVKTGEEWTLIYWWTAVVTVFLMMKTGQLEE